MAERITDEMRKQLRESLPQEAVSQHPTKTYLSSIKSIYVAERINDVFGVGSWTLKSEVIERIEKFVVVKAILEIPKYDFYGEAYGGNDNADIGDAYKGATTDGFTKICGQQLEIGIDVFKGKTPTKPSPKSAQSKSSPVKTEGNSKAPTETFIDIDWLKESLKRLENQKGWSESELLSFIKTMYKVEAETVLEAVGKLDKGQAAHFAGKVEETLKTV